MIILNVVKVQNKILTETNQIFWGIQTRWAFGPIMLWALGSKNDIDVLI